MPDRAELTPVEIARLAGVGRAAVSNWRRRHADFPQPVGGTEASPTFALDQVEEWLRRQGKIAELPLLERCHQQLEALREPVGASPGLTGGGGPLVLAGAVLLLVHRHPGRWAELSERPDTGVALALPQAVGELVRELFAPGWAAVLDLPALYGSTQLGLARLLARLAEQHGPAAAYELLLARSFPSLRPGDAPTPGARQPQLPAPAAGLLAALAAADAPETVLDPACGLGATLLAVGPDTENPDAGRSDAGRPDADRPDAGSGRPHPTRFGQERDLNTAGAALLRLALHTPAGTPGPLPLHLASGDALLADGHLGLLADAVLCRPPYNERDWGHDELRYDPRWLFDQAPPRTEPELAWLLHALARTRPGGLTALLLPPTVASRRSGRRLRAELLRSGALRAVVALPAGAAPPFGVPLHLWLLRRPGVEEPPVARRLLLLDAAAAQPAGAAGGGRERIDWPELHRTVLDAWTGFDHAVRFDRPPPADRPGVHRVLDAIDLLDDETDLTPARHLPPAAPADGGAELAHLRGRLAEQLTALAALDGQLPQVGAAAAEPTAAPLTTLGELARTGVLEVHSSGQGPEVRSAADGGAGEGSGRAVLTDQDLMDGQPPSARLAGGATGVLRARPGDVLVPVLGGGTALVVRAGEPADGAVLGARLHLLRPDPELLDPDFLAGRLRSTSGSRWASSHASTTARIDVRRLQLPRLPIDRQRALGAAFRQVAEFEARLRRAAEAGRLLAQGLTDGLADGRITLP
ncbi:N-6 DNA methylase [Kitasatospora viridis]|uniref:N-6 DNA methylase n=1 Tax=Kitasatospora viridis TaxID=281105 RepID=A0A561UFU8_9ACTN|nr:N-6 DNA methylase [Kitasatospora viridis]TWF98225.1 N-6 DNA methylase [Kitasatospora viridis]